MSVDKNRWKCSETSVYNVSYHIIWCTKYRKNVLSDEMQKRLKELLLYKANEIGIEIVSMETMTDHVHLFVRSKPTMAPHYIMRQFKGFSAKMLRSEFSILKRKLPTLWTRSYYVESVGHISETTIRRYIEDQKNK